MTWVQAITALLSAIMEAVKPYIPGLGGVVAGVELQRKKQQETDLEAYRQREKDRREVADLSDDDLDRELRKPPH